MKLIYIWMILLAGNFVPFIAVIEETGMGLFSYINLFGCALFGAFANKVINDSGDGK